MAGYFSILMCILYQAAEPEIDAGLVSIYLNFHCLNTYVFNEILFIVDDYENTIHNYIFTVYTSHWR